MATKYIPLSTEERAVLQQALSFCAGAPEWDRLAKKLAKADQRIKISSAKGKGRGLQYWVCERISEITGIPYVQADDTCEIHSREMGQHGLDIVLRGEARKRFEFSVECKNQESLDLVGTVEQAMANEEKGRPWLIVHRRKALPKEIAIMEWKTLQELLSGKNEKGTKG